MNLKLILSFLNNSQKKKIFFLFILMLISTGLELIGLNIIFLIINFFVNDSLNNINLIEKFLPFSLSKDTLVLMKYLAVLLFSVYFIKFIFQAFFFNFQSSIVFNLQTSLQSLLLRKYISQEYLFFVYRNSSEFTRNIKETIHYFTHGVINPLLNLATEIILAIGVLALLFYYNFLIAVSVIMFFCIIFSIYFLLIKNIAYSIGLKRQNLHLSFFKNLTQLINGIKDIKIYNSENFYVDKFNETNKKLNIKRSQLVFLSLLPKIIFELSLIILISIFLYNISNLGFNTKSALEILSLFAIAAVRLLPSISKIFGSLQGLKVSASSVELLEKEFKLKSEKNLSKKSELIFNKNISIENVSFFYKEPENTILKNIDLKININSKVGIIGESGSGKSTFLDILVGFLKPKQGEIKIDEKITQNGLFELKNKLGYISQEPFLLDDTIKNNVVFGYDEGNDQKIYQVLKKVNMHKFVESLPNQINTLIGERGSKLSGGQAQRIAIARCLYRNPKILIFDEATSSLDVENEDLILETIKQNLQEFTLIIVSHNKNTTKICDEVYKIENKQILRTNKSL